MRVVAAAIATLGLAGPAQAGAWTAEPGDAFVSETRTFGFAETPVPRTDFYAEYGWREGITVGGSVSRDGFLGFGERDDGRASVFMRQRIWQGEAGGVASVEFEIASGFGSGEDTADTTTRIRVGHGFGTPFGDAFVDADIGWRSELALTSGDRLLGGATAACGRRRAGSRCFRSRPIPRCRASSRRPPRAPTRRPSPRPWCAIWRAARACR